jgi:hypothetical protein
LGQPIGAGTGLFSKTSAGVSITPNLISRVIANTEPNAKTIVNGLGGAQVCAAVCRGGVGEEVELHRWSIPLVEHLPGVGQNLQDRYEVGVVNRMDFDNWRVLKGCKFAKGDPQYAEWLVLLGRGERLFEGVDLRTLGYECVGFVASEKATHVVLRHQGRADGASRILAVRTAHRRQNTSGYGAWCT